MRIGRTYHAWRGKEDAGAYAEVCKGAPLAEIKGHGYVLTPGRYVGADAAEEDGEPFEQRMARLVATIKENLRGLGYGA